jgi:hypothetical protein
MDIRSCAGIEWPVDGIVSGVIITRVAVCIIYGWSILRKAAPDILISLVIKMVQPACRATGRTKWQFRERITTC